MPVNVKVPVAALIAPDAGGPTTAPRATIVMEIPTLEPTSGMLTMRIAGDAISPANTPDEAL